MINVSGSYTLGGKTNRNLASQVEQNKRDIQYLLDSGLLPEGELEITENGEYDVKTKASVSVEVPVGIFPTGTKIITSNGSYDVSEFANVLINVSSGNPVNFGEECTINFDEYVDGLLIYRKVNPLTNKIEFISEEISAPTTKKIKICKASSQEFYGDTFSIYDDIFLAMINRYVPPQIDINVQGGSVVEMHEIYSNVIYYRISIESSNVTISKT